MLRIKQRITRRKSRGFTLVELLVVISIIGMLMALLLPAVQSARESGRANTCRNNMRNVGLAIVQYENAKQVYPGYNNRIANTNGFGTVGGNGNGDRSFAFVVLPYMDHRAMYDTLIAPTSAGDTDGQPNGTTTTPPFPGITQTIEVFKCPSNPPEASFTAPMSYVVNSGQLDDAAVPYDIRPNGVFHRGNYVSAVVNSAAYVSGGDGLGTTLMVSENSDLGTWTGLQNLSGTATSERYTGFTCTSATANPPATAAAANTEPLGLNVAFGQSKSSGSPTAWVTFTRPASFHPGNLNVLFCDSHVRAISDTISYQVYQQLISPNGKLAKQTTTGTALPAGHGETTTVPLDEDSIR